MPSFSAMFVRNIMPVCNSRADDAISADITCGPTQRFIVCSFGCACAGVEVAGSGVAVAFVAADAAIGGDCLPHPSKSRMPIQSERIVLISFIWRPWVAGLERLLAC